MRTGVVVLLGLVACSSGGGRGRGGDMNVLVDSAAADIDAAKDASTVAEPSAPRFLSLSSNSSTITPAGSITVTAVLTDPDGIDDLIGGALHAESVDGPAYGSFATSGQEGAYSIELNWESFQLVESIAFEQQETRTVHAVFFDVAGNKASRSLQFILSCDGMAACDGRCKDLATDDEHCGTCGNICEKAGSKCIDGKCAWREWFENTLGTCTRLCGLRDGICHPVIGGCHISTLGSGEFAGCVTEGESEKVLKTCSDRAESMGGLTRVLCSCAD